MPIDFFNEECRSIYTYEYFGLCDDTDYPPDQPTPAYAIPYHEELWVATVENANKNEITFVAVDHCVIKSIVNGEPRPQSCDCLIASKNELIFVELKERKYRGWLSKGLAQLESTIHLYNNNKQMPKFNTRKAYLANKARPDFKFTTITEKEQFKDNTDFELYVDLFIPIN